MPTIELSRPPALSVTDPDGNTIRIEIHEFPFRIGRQSGNQLMLRDARASRNHAEITVESGELVLEDLNSRHGTWVNGERIRRHALHDRDRITFGVPEGYTLIFERPAAAPGRSLDALAAPVALNAPASPGGDLARLRAVLEVGRALQNAFSLDMVLEAVVDAALSVTGADRGFLLLKQKEELEICCGRDRGGPLSETDLRVPRKLILRALNERSDAFSMQFDPNRETNPSSTVSALELRSVLCIPLVRVRIGADDQREPGEAVGVLYLDSRAEQRDLAANNGEVLETIAIEASTALENARLIEEERARQHVEEELAVARSIQQSLLPSELPETGWLRASGFSRPSREVGGDYFDLLKIGEDQRLVIVADVAGKGVSSALVASMLQGAFLTVTGGAPAIRSTLERMNRFLCDRAAEFKYATVFCAIISRDGRIEGVNAGHPPAILVPLNGPPEMLPATAPPVGLVETAEFEIDDAYLKPGDRLVLYTDGVTDARNAGGDLYGRERLLSVIRDNADRPCALLHDAINENLTGFIGTAEQPDDLTLLVVDYRPED
jgi:serine phosphatase RsbU (regulator of sigma subunit)